MVRSRPPAAAWRGAAAAPASAVSAPAASVASSARRPRVRAAGSSRPRVSAAGTTVRKLPDRSVVTSWVPSTSPSGAVTARVNDAATPAAGAPPGVAAASGTAAARCTVPVTANASPRRSEVVAGSKSTLRAEAGTWGTAATVAGPAEGPAMEPAAEPVAAVAAPVPARTGREARAVSSAVVVAMRRASDGAVPGAGSMKGPRERRERASGIMPQTTGGTPALRLRRRIYGADT